MATTETVETPAGTIPRALYDWLVSERRDALARAGRLGQLLGLEKKAKEQATRAPRG